jgi:hypothetical protein
MAAIITARLSRNRENCVIIGPSFSYEFCVRSRTPRRIITQNLRNLHVGIGNKAIRGLATGKPKLRRESASLAFCSR